ncbi:MAG: HD domain-containing protein [Spirochaetes bacterium]|nr:HD domain-containing protein [Spirochaetota bacterium]
MKKYFVNKISEKELKRRNIEKKVDVRGDYYRDQTAIIHSLPFRRMKKKTQVFFAPNNDHICTRIEHVLHVTSVATTICKGLNLDIELAQAIALGHDLGHPPFGHVGEYVLDELQKKISGVNSYKHEIFSFRVVEYIANKGKGLNLCYAVKNGIIAHCGEKFEQYIEPDFEIVDLNKINNLEINPCTYEGCVVRMADKISYLGRDIEDAMRLKIVNSKNIDKEILDILNVDFRNFKDSVNKLIINRLILDIIENSINKGKIGFSDDAHEFMKKIKEFNYKNIYHSKIIENYNYFVKKVINIIYHELSEIFNKYNFDYAEYKNHFIKPFRDFSNYIESYKDFYQKTNTTAHSIIIDYIAGMTDNYALDFCKKVILPKRIF